MSPKTLDTVTSVTGLLASVSGALAGYGVAPHYTVPIAAGFAAIFSWFTQKPATPYQPAQGNYAPWQPPQGGSNG